MVNFLVLRYCCMDVLTNNCLIISLKNKKNSLFLSYYTNFYLTTFSSSS